MRADRGINHERMPVLLSDPADFETWLSGSTEDAFKLARSYAADQMRIVQSGSERKDLLQAALRAEKGGTLIRLHQTRLMRRGEVALWHRGTIVWQGSVGATINGVNFDAVSINIEDGERVANLIGQGNDRR